MEFERLIELLEIISVSGGPVAVADIVEIAGLPKPTCYRLVQKLREQNLIVDHNNDGRYVIAERLLRIATHGRTDHDVTRAVLPLFNATVNNINEAMFLGRLRNGRVDIVHVTTPEHSDRSFIHPGLGERPLHACSCSKAIIAFADPAFRQSILNKNLRRFTEHTKTTEDELETEFQTIRERGFADCDQEIDIGIGSVAAPVMVGSLGTFYSVGAVGPVRRFGLKERYKVGEQLNIIAKKMGGSIALFGRGNSGANVH